MIAILITMVLIGLILFLIDLNINISNEYNTNFINYTNSTIIIIFLVSAYITLKLFSIGKIRISLQDDHIKIFWVKKFFLSKKVNTLIKWKDIKYYNFENDTLCDYLSCFNPISKYIFNKVSIKHSFEIILNSGRKYKINKYSFIFNDDFKKFRLNLINHIDKINKNENLHIKGINDY